MPSATAPTTRCASPARSSPAKVIGEGANLGMTQRGRIEAAQARPAPQHRRHRQLRRVNTSDVEVNLKIALAVPMRDGRISREARNTLLHAMTEDVAALVLRNNYQQSLALSLAERRGSRTSASSSG